MASQQDTTVVDFKERLIGNVKREVKQVMEEAVTRRGVREDSGAVTSLCAAVEACLGQGLRRRALGLFKTSSTTALLHKVAKHCEEAAAISQKVLALEATEPCRRSSSSGDSTNRPPLTKKGSMGSVPSSASSTVRYLWIRLALFERRLARIIEHLVRHAPRYYERGALVADPDCGSILASLLVGPCALEYSRARPPDRYWPDPPAGELVQRHRISAGTTTPPPCRRPILNFRRSLNTSSEDAMATSAAAAGSSAACGVGTTVATCAKDYVESLHQNSRATLLYGKNNVLVHPPIDVQDVLKFQKDVPEPMAGYLSLHQMAQSLVIKWTPNQLMNGFAESETTDKSSYWQYALNVSLEDVVYVHCHQGEGGGGTVVLVGQDGVQRPPIHFPKGGHLLAFLSCLETGLLPHGQLDPPLWSQRGSGKVLPHGRPRRRPLPIVSEGGSTSVEDPEAENNYISSSNNDSQATDYVFRIVNNNINHQEYGKYVSRHSLMERGPASPRALRKPLGSASTTGSSDSSSMSLDTHPPPLASPLPQDAQPVQQTASIALVCSTMRRQIISRAFYGWLAYCRHLSTVRTHLSGLVNTNIVPSDGASGGLTKERWEAMTDEAGVVANGLEIYRLTYYGGVDHEIRKEVWPYLLGYYKFGSTAEERKEQELTDRRRYETTMSEWLAVEAIVRQRDREATAASIARLAEPKANAENNHEVSEDNSFISDDDNPPVISPDQSETQDASHLEKCDEEHSSQCNDSSTTRKTIALVVESSVDENVDMPEETQEEMEVEQIESNNLERDDITEQNQSEIRKIAESMARINGHVNGGIEDDAMPICDEDNFGKDIAVTVQNHTSVIVTNPSVDIVSGASPLGQLSENVSPSKSPLGALEEERNSACTSFDTLDCPLASQETNKEGPRSNCVSPASSNGGVYSIELLENFGLNLHRIDKDVQRCDRNYWYFTGDNLDKLRNVMSTYVWEHMEAGYMQGMCDLAAPLLVLLDDEAAAYSAFCCLMSRMLDNFPAGGAMDAHFANMRSLIQILDCEMYELMHAHGDYTHFYFCYRWFLLDFKRELLYQDVFSAWEMIWAARHISSSHMVLFLALALLESYRDIILSNSMDFTDIIKFFNEMAERHNAPSVLSLARDLVLQLQTLIENK